MAVAARSARDEVRACLTGAQAGHGVPGDGVRRALPEVLADDAALLRARHAVQLEEGATPAASAKWLAARAGGPYVRLWAAWTRAR